MLSPIERYFASYAPVESPPDFIVCRGEGSYLYDTEGRRYLDFSAGLAVQTLGYGDPGVISAIEIQAKKITHTGSEILNHATLNFAETLRKIAPDYHLFLSNSGAEANEAALKIARRWGNRSGFESKREIVSFENSFHGRTLFCVSVAANPPHISGFGPPVSGVRKLPFNDVEMLAKGIGEATSAVIFEIIQGRGSCQTVNQEFLRELSRLREKFGFLIIIDEIQTGIGRLGRFFGHELFDIDPDIVTIAKGVGGGMPLGVTMVRSEHKNLLNMGSHGTTFGGNPIACAAGVEIIERVIGGDFLDQVVRKGTYLKAGLKEIGNLKGMDLEITGSGLMVSARIERDSAKDVQKRCIDSGLIIRIANDDVLRFTPPLSVSSEEIDEALSILIDVVR